MASLWWTQLPVSHLPTSTSHAWFPRLGTCDGSGGQRRRRRQRRRYAIEETAFHRTHSNAGTDGSPHPDRHGAFWREGKSVVCLCRVGKRQTGQRKQEGGRRRRRGRRLDVLGVQCFHVHLYSSTALRDLVRHVSWLPIFLSFTLPTTAAATFFSFFTASRTSVGHPPAGRRGRRRK